MCTVCGCNDPEHKVKITSPGNKYHLITSDNNENLLKLEKNILHKNNHEAKHNREHFDNKNILSINLVSSPGSGKTTLLEKTILGIKDKFPLYVIEGDQETMLDARRIQATGTPVVQVNTGKGCHLDAAMIHRALHQLEPIENSILWIENVGNLVCPALFDLGEKLRIVIISVTEGEDKPLKYPHMFASADICIINKTDLLPYVDFSVEKTKEYVLRINHKLQFFEVSATKGDGMNSWFNWIRKQHEKIAL